MTYQLAVYLSFSIAIGALLAVIRFSKINKAWLPFILALWLGLANEVLSYIITHRGHSNSVNNNFYILAESVLFMWQFYNWGVFKSKKWLFPLLVGMLIVWWIVEVIILHAINLPMTYFRIFYSFIMVILAINSFNEQLIKETHNIWINPVFLVSIGYLLYFTYKVITGSFRIYGFRGTDEFNRNIVIALIYINCIANLIYAFAVLCMDRKHPSSLR